MTAAQGGHDALPEAVVQAAIEWLIRLQYQAPGPAGQRQFEQWLAADALHREAWARVASLTQPFSLVPTSLVRHTLQLAQQRRSQAPRRKTLKLLGLAGLLLATGRASQHSPAWSELWPDAATATGEQRQLQLADGSRLLLNTDSAVNIRLDPSLRLIRLLRGELLINTGPDAGSGSRRPFRVDTPFGLLEAMGTRFVVRLQAQAAQVCVSHGAVALYPAAGGAPMLLRPGQSARMSAMACTPMAQPADEAFAWSEGVIIARRMPLQQLLAELGRYHRAHVRCHPQIAGMPVSGVFQTADSAQTLAFLAQSHGLRLQHFGPWWATLSPTPA